MIALIFWFALCRNTRNEFCHSVIALWLPPLKNIFYNILLMEERIILLNAIYQFLSLVLYIT